MEECEPTDASASTEVNWLFALLAGVWAWSIVETVQIGPERAQAHS
jgi:hypothetical protein